MFKLSRITHENIGIINDLYSKSNMSAEDFVFLLLTVDMDLMDNEQFKNNKFEHVVEMLLEFMK